MFYKSAYIILSNLPDFNHNDDTVDCDTNIMPSYLEYVCQDFNSVKNLISELLLTDFNTIFTKMIWYATGNQTRSPTVLEKLNYYFIFTVYKRILFKMTVLN